MEFPDENQPNQLNQSSDDDIVLFLQNCWPKESKTSLGNYLGRLEKIGNSWLVNKTEAPDFAREVITMCAPLAAVNNFSPLRFVNVVAGLRFLYGGQIRSTTPAALAVRALLFSFLSMDYDDQVLTKLNQIARRNNEN